MLQATAPAVVSCEYPDGVSAPPQWHLHDGISVPTLERC